MKNLKTLFLAAFSIGMLTGCEKTATDEFEETNGNIENKRMKNITIISDQDASENKNIVLSYTNNNQLFTISDGEAKTYFVYQEGKLADIAGQNDNLTIEKLYESPYDAFETGEVDQYDENGNPHIIVFFEEEYDYYSDYTETKEYTAEITYDDAHNPYFYTLEAAGIMEVLDGVRLNFSMVPEAPEIVQARDLFPLNNPSTITYRNEEDEILHTINIDYDYDEQNYPISAAVTSDSREHQEISTFVSNFQYVD